jgi:release factor glutamine methyltransferase
MTDYCPTVPTEVAQRMRGWHDEHYAVLRNVGEDGLTVDYLGLELLIPPQVQVIEPTSDLLGRAVLDEVRPGDRVLDMGTGSGVNAILAARVAASVTAVDISPHALAAARGNAARNGVADRVSVHRSDVFSHVHGRFDLVVFDPPFRWFRPRDWAEAAITDENYRALTDFFEQVSAHLTPGGRVLVFFGTTADVGYLEQLVDDNGFTREVVARRAMDKDGHPVEYRTYRLVR